MNGTGDRCGGVSDRITINVELCHGERLITRCRGVGGFDIPRGQTLTFPSGGQQEGSH